MHRPPRPTRPSVATPRGEALLEGRARIYRRARRVASDNLRLRPPTLRRGAIGARELLFDRLRHEVHHRRVRGHTMQLQLAVQRLRDAGCQLDPRFGRLARHGAMVATEDHERRTVWNCGSACSFAAERYRGISPTRRRDAEGESQEARRVQRAHLSALREEDARPCPLPTRASVPTSGAGTPDGCAATRTPHDLPSRPGPAGRSADGAVLRAASPARPTGDSAPAWAPGVTRPSLRCRAT
jgi:hypothetical protein